MEITAFHLASRFIGLKEVPGHKDHPMILAMLKLDSEWPDGDEVPWCSAFINYVCWLLRLPRSKHLRARSWLGVGQAIELSDAKVGWDIVVLKRGDGEQPGPEVLDAPGHVGFYAGHNHTWLQMLGGNQNNMVSVVAYDVERLLGVRRLI